MQKAGELLACKFLQWICGPVDRDRRLILQPPGQKQRRIGLYEQFGGHEQVLPCLADDASIGDLPEDALCVFEFGVAEALQISLDGAGPGLPLGPPRHLPVAPGVVHLQSQQGIGVGDAGRHRNLLVCHRGDKVPILFQVGQQVSNQVGGGLCREAIVQQVHLPGVLPPHHGVNGRHTLRRAKAGSPTG